MKTRIGVGRALATFALVAMTTGLIAGDAVAGPQDRKMSRQIGLFERIVDDMLVDSPNWLVQGRNETRGTYVEGHGAIFTFDASLVNAGWGSHDGGKWWNWMSHDKWSVRGDKRVIIIGDDEDWDDEDWDDEDSEDSDKDDRSDRRARDEKYRDREMKQQERRYTRGKLEVVDMLADFGDVLTTLADTDTIEIEAFLESASYFYDKDLSRLSVRAKMSDIRAYADGKIDQKTLVQRIQTKES